MNENITKAEVLVGALIAAGTALWGWFGWLVLIFIGCMILDYITGSLAAKKNGEWSSEVARNGLWHKGGMILIVLVAGLFDLAIGLIINNIAITLPFSYSVFLCPVVMAMYTITELGSMAENAAKMGAPVPEWLRKALKITAGAIDKTGEKITGGNDNDGG